MAKKSPKKRAKSSKVSTRSATAAELHEAARVARRGGDPEASAKLLEQARAAERVEAGR